jgi:hypothetical protein
MRSHHGQCVFGLSSGGKVTTAIPATLLANLGAAGTDDTDCITTRALALAGFHISAWAAPTAHSSTTTAAIFVIERMMQRQLTCTGLELTVDQ